MIDRASLTLWQSIAPWGSGDKKGHNVLYLECEEIFFNKPLILKEDTAHSQKENRYYVLGKTNADRKLFIAFTLRENLIRVISARDMSKKEGKSMSKKKLPKFKNAAEEHKFWQNHDSTDYIDWSEAKSVSFPNLTPSKITISLRLPEILLNDIKTLANKRDVPYQSLIKILLAEKMNEETRRIVGR